jgi:uncharacterized membrane protein YkvA (DUF1232 family)
MGDEGRPIQGPQDETGAVQAWLEDVVRQLRLAWRLFFDERVPLWTKVVPPAALAYVLSPIDILSDFPPVGLNQLDDVAIVFLGIKMFIELAPPDVVREHLEDLGARIQEWRVVDEESSVVEGRYEISEPAKAEEEGTKGAER